MNGTIKQATATRMLCGVRNTNEATPRSFYEQLNAEFAFNYDPCPLNPTPTTNGLVEVWGKRAYINPPYGKEIRMWLEKANKEIEIGNTEIAVFLLPAYTDVKWFHEVVLPKGEIRFIKGRLKFGKHNNTAPFASMIVIFRQTASQFATEERCDAPHAANLPAGKLAVASESAGGNVAIGKPDLQDKTKPEAPENALQRDRDVRESGSMRTKPYTCQECGERHCWITEANRSHKKTKPERFSKANNRKWKAAHKKVK